MKQLAHLSFVKRVILCMALSLALNVCIGYSLKHSLSGEDYGVTVNAQYSTDGSMQLLYDTGSNFNHNQRVSTKAQKGQNTLFFPFQLTDGEQLRNIRLDFGSDVNLKQVSINSVSLVHNNKALFRLEKDDIIKKLGLQVCISNTHEANGTLEFNTTSIPFDPYIVFDPVNELIYPKWQRTILLVMPWLVLFLLPLLSWLGKLKKEGEYVLFFVGLFVVAIPLKIAWVTFTSLLLLGCALLIGYKKRYFQFGGKQIALLLFFLTPFLFLGEGNPSKLLIPLGFVIFALIGSLINFTSITDDIKKIYITVFFVLTSITLVSWLVLMCYNGYFYTINWANYFTEIKSNAHATMFWLYYPHTTFLSFFIIVGGVFCLELYEKKQLTKPFALVYAFFGFCALILLGSRFALFLGVLVPFLYHVPVKKLSRLLLPIWAAFLAGIIYYVSFLDVQRERLWSVAWTAFKDKFWLGHGTGTSNTVLPDHLLIDKGGIETLMKVNHSHNQFLSYLIENGFLGTLLFLIAFMFLFYKFVKQDNKTMLLISFMILMLMIIESPFKTTTALYVIAFLLSVFHLPQKTQVRTEVNDF